MEILIVIALIAIIGTLTVTQIGNIFDTANEDIAQEFVNSALKAPLLKYRIDCDSYPTSADGGLIALLEEPSTRQGKWRGPYVEELPNDLFEHFRQGRIGQLDRCSDVYFDHLLMPLQLHLLEVAHRTETRVVDQVFQIGHFQDSLDEPISIRRARQVGCADLGTHAVAVADLVAQPFQLFLATRGQQQVVTLRG